MYQSKQQLEALTTSMWDVEYVPTKSCITQVLQKRINQACCTYQKI